MEPTSAREMHKVLANRLASRKVDDAVIEKLAHRVAKNGLKIGKIDFCPYGICIDYFANKVSIDELLVNDRYRVVKLFPWGIIDDDFWHVHVEMQAPELEGHFG